MEDVQRERRRERAREGAFEVVRLAGEPPEATWAVRSESGRTYEVEVLALRTGAYRCSCRDFLTNTLGTCKHVEAVLLHLDEHHPKAVATARFSRPPLARVYLHHGEELRIRLLRPRSLEPELEDLLDRYFDPDGDFIGEVWRDFGGFRRDAEALGNVRIDPDARDHARELREGKAREARLERESADVRGGRELGVTRRVLAPFQRLGALHLARRQRAILADELGLGAIAQAVAGAEILRRERDLRTLVVCPASRKGRWAGAIHDLTGEHAAVAEGDARARHLQYSRRAPYTVVNYELLLRDPDELAGLRADLLVLDEAQRIRNWRTKTAAAVKDLQTPYAFVLCDAALEEDLDALYSVMQVVDQRQLGPLWRFNRNYFVLDERGRVHGYKNLDQLRERLAPVFLRRRFAEVRDQLPEASREVYRVPLSAASAQALQAAVAAVAAAAPGDGDLAARLGECKLAADGLDDEVPAKAAELAEVLQPADDPPLVVASTARLAQAAREALAARELEARVMTDADLLEDEHAPATLLVHLDLPWSPDDLAARARAAGHPGRELFLVAAESLEDRLLTDPDRARRLGLGGAADAPTLDAGVTPEDLASLLTAPPAAAPDPPVPPGQQRTLFAPAPGAPEAAPEASAQADRPPPLGAGPGSSPGPAGARAEGPAPARREARTTRGGRPPRTTGARPLAVPADPAGAAEALAAALRPVLGDSLRGVERLGPGLVAVVRGDLGTLRGTVRALARGLGLEPLVLDETTLDDLRPFFGPTLRARTTGAQRARLELDKGRAKLAAAHALLEAGLPHEALAPTRRGVEAAARAMLLAQGEAVEDPELLSAVYAKLVRTGKLAAAEAGTLSRVRDLAEMASKGGADLIDRALARGALQDARRLVEAANAAVGA